jgi:hypothetical protein
MSAADPDPREVLAARRELLPRFEDELGRRSPPSLERALAIVDALLDEARLLGVWPPADPLEGIEVDVRVAEALRRVR